jgi:hypothetical protein
MARGISDSAADRACRIGTRIGKGDWYRDGTRQALPIALPISGLSDGFGGWDVRLTVCDHARMPIPPLPMHPPACPSPSDR